MSTSEGRKKKTFIREGRKNGEAENSYELLRKERIEQNNMKFKSLGLPALAQAAYGTRQKVLIMNRRRIIQEKNLVDDDYQPDLEDEENEDEDNDNDDNICSKRKFPCVAQAKKKLNCSSNIEEDYLGNDEIAQPKIVHHPNGPSMSKRARIGSSTDTLQDEELEDESNSVFVEDDSIEVSVEKSQPVPEPRKKRGPTRCSQLYEIGTQNKYTIDLNGFGQPIGPPENAKKLSSYMGTLVRKHMLAPLTCVDWKKMPEDNKERMWKRVTDVFIIDENKGKPYILQTLGDLWRGYKCRVKRDHFKPYNTKNDWLKARPAGIPMDHWEALIDFWNSDEEKVISGRNSENRSRQKNIHRRGRMTFARVFEDEINKDPLRKELSGAQKFILTRTNRDNCLCVDDESKEEVDILRKSVSGQEESEVDTSQVLNMLVKPKFGRVPLHGRGVTPSQVIKVAQNKQENEALIAKIKILEAKDEKKSKEITELRNVCLSMMKCLQDQNPDMIIPSVLLCDEYLSPFNTESAPKQAQPPMAATHNSMLVQEVEIRSERDEDEELHD